jgi:hypothetical protein
MGKFLRIIETYFVDAAGRPDPVLLDAFRSAKQVHHLCWMYQHYALPAPSGGISKVNVCFTRCAADPSPTEALGIATVFERFDAAQFARQSAEEQSRTYLDGIHSGVIRCANLFGWDPQPFEAARQRAIQERFQFAFFWKKPVASPDRKHRAQAHIDAAHPGTLALMFCDRESHEVRRSLLSRGVDAPGVAEFLLGDLKWIDAETVKVTQQNQRDYWLCRLDGAVEFHYPRAEAGDAHGLYDLGCMYYEGQYVLQDRERGLELIASAAQRGYPHAVKFLARPASDGDNQHRGVNDQPVQTPSD